jgi:hypothetical protein
MQAEGRVLSAEGMIGEVISIYVHKHKKVPLIGALLAIFSKF